MDWFKRKSDLNSQRFLSKFETKIPKLSLPFFEGRILMISKFGMRIQKNCCIKFWFYPSIVPERKKL
ncbi:hypothetical protein DLM75_10350 [Leptospira stimsonii]|uniref:Uncharacterized protein n=1 Tax=Leptospira stimsonii TaxID=2202203 RepID=A0A396ZAC9_9LEPT|nr:hypothetical protein DLM75_10350 [Leptospira stimsonii]